MKRLNHRRLMPIVLTLLLVTLGTLFLGVMMAHAAPPEPTDLSPAAPQALPDMTLETFSIEPEPPSIDDPISITIKAKNIGLDNADGARVYLYINPTDRPPISTTEYTGEAVYGIPISPTNSFTAEFLGITDAFTTTGCNHVIYAMVDPLERTEESDETNNMRAIHLCVDPADPGPQPGADAFEPDDDCGTQATPITTDGVAQVHNFSPVTDTDYISFTVTAGKPYTITAAGTGRDADPNIEISDSCVFGGAFGSTARMNFIAPDDDTYFVRITNAHATPDPTKTTYELTVQTEGGEPTTGDPPIPLGISPISGTNDANTNVVITGTQFVFPTMAELCAYENDACTQDCIQLLETSWLGAEKIIGVVPPFDLDASPPTLLTPGPYCLQLTNPGGKQGVKPNAYTVRPAAPVLNSLNPEQGYSDKPIDLHIYGFNFVTTGLTLKLDTQNLEDVKLINSTHLLATIPSGQAPGTYDVSASYAAGQSGTLLDAFTVLESAEDLYGTPEELWRSPVTPRANAPVELGLVVHRKGGIGPLRDLPVRFEVDGAAVATPTVELLTKNGQSSTPGVIYTPTAEGQLTVVATIDPEQAFDDATRANNVVTRVIDVQPPAADGQAPHVDSFTINGEMTPTVTTRAVTLTAEASDNSGQVAQIRYIEFEYNQGAGLWVPVQDSEWLNYSLNHQDHAWTLTPVGGMHYIQAWAKDAEGNISEYPYQRRVDYMKPIETVARNQARVYRRDLEAGESLNVQLEPRSGDPDLYIWPPDWAEGRPPWVSNLEGIAEDSLAFVAPVKGTYQIEVYGYTRAEYELTIQVGGGLHTASSPAERRLLRPSAISGIKWPMVAPAISPDNAPPRNGAGGSSPPNPTTLDNVTISQVVSETVSGGHVYTITATTAPTNAARPLFYHWEATGQPPVTHTVNTTAITDVITYTWSSAASQAVTVTVVNAGNQVNATHSISGSTDFHHIYLPLVLRLD